MVHNCNPNTGEAKATESQVGGQSVYTARLCPKRPRAGVVTQWKNICLAYENPRFSPQHHTHTHTHSHTHTHTHSHIHTHAHTQTHAPTYTLTHAHTHTPTHSRAHTLTHIHTLTHSYT
jgi:hypothetical protein